METIDILTPSEEILAPQESRQCFRSLIEHWAKARIEGPMQAIARYDEACKQLVTIGSLMQGLLVAAYSLMVRQQADAAAAFIFSQRLLIYSFLASLFCFFVCTVVVCWMQPRMDASSVHKFLVKAMGECFTEKDLSEMVGNWCQDIDGIRRKKKWWLTFACGFFMICSLLMMALLLLPLMPAAA